MMYICRQLGHCSGICQVPASLILLQTCAAQTSLLQEASTSCPGVHIGCVILRTDPAASSPLLASMICNEEL